ncbi:hypothetical protein Tco_0845369 [Tanacetum coccineum]
MGAYAKLVEVLILYQAYSNLYTMTAFGKHLEENHVTWARFEKKLDKNTTLGFSERGDDVRICYDAVRRSNRPRIVWSLSGGDLKMVIGLEDGRDAINDLSSLLNMVDNLSFLPARVDKWSWSYEVSGLFKVKTLSKSI